MTDMELVKAGFKMYNPSSVDRYDTLYQYRVRDEIGTRYFVNVYRWDMRKYGHGVIWDADLVSNDGAEWWGNTIRIKTACSDKTPAELLAWADQMWSRLQLTYYEKD